ncbi:MAG: hypothetical protein AAFN77_13155 [Planctomycetota bacterium]
MLWTAGIAIFFALLNVPILFMFVIPAGILATCACFAYAAGKFRWFFVSLVAWGIFLVLYGSLGQPYFSWLSDREIVVQSILFGFGLWCAFNAYRWGHGSTRWLTFIPLFFYLACLFYVLAAGFLSWNDVWKYWILGD